MENDDLELRDLAIVQESVQRLISLVKDEEDKHTRSSPSIYMTPSRQRDLSPSSFNPQVVSIGPLHREDENVQAFEKQKASYMKSLMGRLTRFGWSKEEILKSCMRKAYGSLDKIKACYVWPKAYSDAEIAEMMVMDACFILEFMAQVHRFGTREPYTLRIMIKCDLILLENQIPLFFLDEIHQCTLLNSEPAFSFIELLCRFLQDFNLFTENLRTDNISINNIPHILGLLHKCYNPQNNNLLHVPIRSTNPLEIPSAVDLHKAGVTFKPNKDPTWVMAMTMEVKSHRFEWFFRSWTKPTFTMPVLEIHDGTELVLRNLIAYEHSHSSVIHYNITSYAVIIDKLVNTQEDVAMLVDSGVISNQMGSHDEDANMINGICKNVRPVTFYNEQCKALNEYRNSYWPKHIARMRSTYFSSPWTMIALLAGIILFALTAVQTIFTII